jgi:signal peptidase I
MFSAVSPDRHRTHWLRRGALVVAGFVLCGVGVIVIQGRFVRVAMHPYRIPSSAMEPTLHCARPIPGCEGNAADRVLVPRFHPFWTPSRGDIVVFHAPESARSKCGAGGTFVKRIVGLPKEHVRIRLRGGVGYVYVDGKPLDEPYVENDRRDVGPEDTYRVPAGQYFVMGDNRSQSCDSRVWGSVPRANLVGRVVARYWPPDRIGAP